MDATSLGILNWTIHDGLRGTNDGFPIKTAAWVEHVTIDGTFRFIPVIWLDLTGLLFCVVYWTRVEGGGWRFGRRFTVPKKKGHRFRFEKERKNEKRRPISEVGRNEIARGGDGGGVETISPAAVRVYWPAYRNVTHGRAAMGPPRRHYLGPRALFMEAHRERERERERTHLESSSGLPRRCLTETR